MSTRQELVRVQDRIGDAVLAFQQQHPGGPWHMDALRRFVERSVGAVAPASPDRILRALRAAGRVNYRVVSRSKSLYEWQPVLSTRRTSAPRRTVARKPPPAAQFSLF